MQYSFVLYYFDRNVILEHSTKNRSDMEMLKSHTILDTYLDGCEITPRINIIDNKYPKALKTIIRERTMKYQLVNIHKYHISTTERDITTFKNHCIASVCSTDKYLPIYLWDLLPEQTMVTLNLVQNNQINPWLCAKY